MHACNYEWYDMSIVFQRHSVSDLDIMENNVF